MFKGGLHVTFGHFYFVTQLLNEFKKVHKSIHFQKGNFTRNTVVMLNFDQNSQFLRKSPKTRFLPLFVQNGLEIDKNFKN